MKTQRVDPFDTRSLWLSCGLHVVLLALVWLSTLYTPPVLDFVTYEIEMVSPPPAVEAEEPTEATEELVVERPDPEPTPPEPEVEEVVPIEDPEDEPPPPAEEPRETEEEPPEPEEEATVAAAPEAEPEETEVSGEDINVRIEGLRRDFPEYYGNIVRQIERCLRWQGGGRWEAAVYFVIRRDGTVTDLRFDTRSGNATFDFQAMGAVECAGDRGRIGPLPEELPYDRQPILFRFRPPGSAPFELLLGDQGGTVVGRPTVITSDS